MYRKTFLYVLDKLVYLLCRVIWQYLVMFSICICYAEIPFSSISSWETLTFFCKETFGIYFLSNRKPLMVLPSGETLHNFVVFF